jgi:hypothetical protein
MPSLDLRFAESKSLVDAVSGQNLITFTRASTGTYVDSDGVIRSAATNLLLRSEEFNDASWSKTRTSVTPDAATSPNGLSTADKIIATATTGSHRVFVSGVSLTGNRAVTVSIYAKAAEYAKLEIGFGNVGGAFSAETGVAYTLEGAGSTSNEFGLDSSHEITAVGDGWYRCQITVTPDGTGTATANFYLYNSTGQFSYTGDGTSGLFLWGAQLEVGSTATTYLPTGATINSAPRFDHNPLTGECLGLLVEEQRQNLLLNSATLSTQTVTVTAVAHTLSFYGTGTVTLSGTSTAGPLVGTAANSRVSLTFTPTAGSLTLTVSGSVTNANLEIGSFPTSWIPTTGTAATRTADVVSITTAGGNVRSLFTSFRSPASGTRPVVSLDDNTANERIEILTSGTDPKLLVTDGGSAVADLDAGTVTANTLASIAARFNTDDYAISIDGGTSQLDAAGTLPTVNRIRIGSNQAGGYLSGSIARVTAWDSALPLLPSISQ